MHVMNINGTMMKVIHTNRLIYARVIDGNRRLPRITKVIKHQIFAAKCGIADHSISITYNHPLTNELIDITQELGVCHIKPRLRR
jgi:hypothetical protein